MLAGTFPAVKAAAYMVPLCPFPSRQRENLVAAAAMCVQHMQKALTEMNIQLANVISDISGTTGMAILRDIVRGERDPEKLARHKHARIRASHQEIARSLEGTWREELLFVVGQSLELYDTYQEKIQLCDQRIDEHLHRMEAKVDPASDPIPEPTRRGKGSRPRQPHFDLRGHLYRITGVDLTQIDSIDVRIAQTAAGSYSGPEVRWGKLGVPVRVCRFRPGDGLTAPKAILP